MSVEEQEANDRDAALSNEQVIATLQHDLEMLADDWRGKKWPIEALARKTALEDELRERRARRRPEATPETVKGQLDRMWAMLRTFEERVTALEESFNGWMEREVDQRVRRQQQVDIAFVVLLLVFVVDVVARVVWR